jgi:hypothetical protein
MFPTLKATVVEGRPMNHPVLRRLIAGALALTCSGCASFILRPPSTLEITVLTDRNANPSDVTVTVQNLKDGQAHVMQGPEVRFPLKGHDDFRVTASMPGEPTQTKDVRYNSQRNSDYVYIDHILGAVVGLCGLAVGAAVDWANRDVAGQAKAIGTLSGIGLWALMLGIDSLTAPPVGHRPGTVQFNLRTAKGR